MSLHGLAVVPASARSEGHVRVEAAGYALLLAQAPLDGVGMLQALRALMDEGPALPLGRRARFADAQAAHAWLEESACRLGPAIARVAGRCELILSLSAPEPVAAEAASGAGYLRARSAALSERERRQEELARKAEAILHDLGEDRRLLPYVEAGRLGLDGSVLVREAGAAAVREEICRRAQDLPGFIRVRIAGPWPPVTFAAALDEEPPA